MTPQPEPSWAPVVPFAQQASLFLLVLLGPFLGIAFAFDFGFAAAGGLTGGFFGFPGGSFQRSASLKNYLNYFSSRRVGSQRLSR
ncbi:hypothetical protein SAMN05878249_2775 [Vreelandella aquamarina]|uniref:Uncharacterized protein n=1 Tax=Vreelandella aquamarina TaxID=77097 RepID=A0A1N6DHQ7_9GAMM|nr:hypothetical protein SAMN05878438_0556 [Halomonas meridiana]SIN70266.1 hypothetical protein SAMN05878249_2775 [Halomonas meridiana]SIO26202.1 hypothetical protein SAMN05878442_1832 [Halomonas meridiana]